MIKPYPRDMNRSRDVAGPKLLRSKDQENTMADDKTFGGDHGNLFHDDHPTGTLSKHPLSELHQGHHEVPLAASGEQGVVVSSDMGSDHPDYVPTLAKGSTRDQAHSGSGKASGGYSEESKSAPHSESGGREKKGMGRSIAKEMGYKAKKSLKG